MKVDKAADLMFWTYFMVDWSKVGQEPSDMKCAQCGKPMNQVEQAVDSSGKRFDGYVCHPDKRLIWVRAG